MKNEYTKVENVQNINWDSDEDISKIKWNDRKLNPLDNMHNIWITHDLSNNKFSLFMDKPTLEEDGVWRSRFSRWCKLDIKWPVSIRRGECKHFRLFEELIQLT